MAIDFIRETPVTLAVACRTLLPRPNGRPLSTSTPYRWISRGILAGDGARVYLEAAKVGRAYMTTAAAVRAFLDELTRRSGRHLWYAHEETIAEAADLSLPAESTRQTEHAMAGDTGQSEGATPPSASGEAAIDIQVER